MNYCSGTIQNNFIWLNSAIIGGGISDCNGGVICNNTIWNNRAILQGGGICASSSSIINCIIWGNSDALGVSQIYNSSTPAYSCIQGWTGGGTGNFNADPRLLLPEFGEFHLQVDSPCIDAGCLIGGLTKDFEGDTRPFNGSNEVRGDGSDYDIGADEYTGTVPVPTPTPVPCVINVPKDKPSIQTAIEAAEDGCEIIVSPGEYRENINFKGKNIVLHSIDPSNESVVAKTIINGTQWNSVVTFKGVETGFCVLDGFTITYGRASVGGGINGNGCLAKIQNNLIRNNTATYNGGGIYKCRGIIQNNTISDNKTTSSEGGSGLDGCSGIIQNNTISGNTGYSVGGLYNCDGPIQNNTISGNTGYNAGGLCNCDGTIQNNIISRNIAIRSVGGGLRGCLGTIQNNFIWMNSAMSGGGLYDCNGGIIRNNTIWKNQASGNGGGILKSTSSITNCIIWGNSATEGGHQIYNSSVPDYCCIQNWTGGGICNINADPKLLQPDSGEFHLKADSPCIDAGCRISALLYDYDGDQRGYNGSLQPWGDDSDYDIGADEFNGVVPPMPDPPAAKIIISQGSQLFLNDPQHAGKYDINAYAGYTDTGALKFWRQAFGSSMSNGITIAAGDPGEIVVGQRELGQNWFRLLKVSDGSGVKWGQAFAPDGSIDGIRVRAYDLDGDGQKEIFCGSIGEQNIIACYKRNGAFVGVWHMFGSKELNGTDFDFDIGDIDGDGYCEIVAGKGPGAQWDDYWNKGVNDFAIYKWTGSYFKFISYHKAYDRYEGSGVSIAVGDVFPENPGLEIVCAQRGAACNEAGCKNYYKVFDYSGKLLYRGQAFAENDGEGLTLSCGDWDNDGRDEIFFGQANCGINKYAVIQLNWYYRYDNYCIYELTGQGFSPEDCDKIYVIPVK